VQWTPINNNPIQDFSKYVISYLQRDTDSSWLTVDVELSATEKVIDGLQPDSEYLFCVSVASYIQGNGIRSPPTGVHTNTDHGNFNALVHVFIPWMPEAFLARFPVAAYVLYCDPPEKPMHQSTIALMTRSQWLACLNRFSPEFGSGF